ncbi:MAG: DUF3854 domain-containing protein [Dehalococcoidia bacterium]|nr:DUF3854 domain-containing protein [Dehalococcoidia bacterium]
MTNEVFSAAIPELMQPHLEHLQASAIDIDVIRERGYKSILGKAPLDEAGFATYQRRAPGILIPMFAPDGSAVGYQYRPDNPRTNGKGKPIKYETPLDAGVRLDMPRRCQPMAGNPNIPILFTEGLKKGDAIASKGGCAVALLGVYNFRGRNEYGGTTLLADFDSLALKDRDVYIAFDSDASTKPQVLNAEARLAEHLRRKGAGVKIIRIPPGPNGEKQGADDFLAAGHTLDDLMALAIEVLPAPTPQPNDGLPTIVVNREPTDVLNDVLKALEAGNNPERLFLRSGRLVRIVSDERDRLAIQELTDAAMCGEMLRVAHFENVSDKRATPAWPPDKLVRVLPTLPGAKFPPLLGLTEVPVVSQDGSVRTTPGYDPESKLFYAPLPGFRMPTITEAPTDNDLKAARDLLLEIFIDFPFDSEASRTNCVGALLGVILKPLIKGPSPAVVVDKPRAGTGASLVCDCISIIATGHAGATMGMPKDDAEMNQTLFSHAMGGTALNVIDNVEAKLISPELARYLTSPEVTQRIMKTQTTVTVPNRMSVFITGNNVRLGGDLPRRCYSVRMDAKLARPWERDSSRFRHPKICQWVSETRGNILAAIYTLAKAWIQCDKPAPEKTVKLGSFESYTAVVGGILEFAGIKGFLGNQDDTYGRSDVDGAQFEAFTSVWSEVFGIRGVTTKELITSEEIMAVLPDIMAPRKDRDHSRIVGNALAKYADTRYGNGLILKRLPETKRHAVLWCVVSYEDANSPSPDIAPTKETDQWKL